MGPLYLTRAHLSKLSFSKSVVFVLGNKLRAEEQKRKEKAAKEEQKRAYGAILQLKQRQRAEVLLFNIKVNLCYVIYMYIIISWSRKYP